MKKLISIILSAVMMLSMSIPVFAAETPNTHFEISSPAFPDAYIITETTPSTVAFDGSSGSLGSISATVFVEETYDMVNNELIITDSRLLSKDEV